MSVRSRRCRKVQELTWERHNRIVWTAILGAARLVDPSDQPELSGRGTELLAECRVGDGEDGVGALGQGQAL